MSLLRRHVGGGECGGAQDAKVERPLASAWTRTLVTVGTLRLHRHTRSRRLLYPKCTPVTVLYKFRAVHPNKVQLRITSSMCRSFAEHIYLADFRMKI